MMINLIYAAARKAAPALHGRSFVPPAVLASRHDHPTGVLSRDELRRAVAEVVG